jgi:SagB-type dehydrogenase family enzyme
MPSGKRLDGTRSAGELGEGHLAASRDAERRERFSRFGPAFDTACPASVLYHLHSNLSPEWDCPLSIEDVSTLTLDLTAYKNYPEAASTALPEAVEVRTPLEVVIRQRRTAETFGRASISLSDFATLLRLACGVTRDGRLPLRAAPSPGGLYAVETYPVVFNVTGLSTGVYHYIPIEHKIECVRALPGVEDLWSALPPGWHNETPALAVVLIARLPRVQAKYGERGYRFVLQESGHIAQNLSLASAALGLAAACVGGFFDDAMNSLIGVDGEREVALYAILIGSEKVGETLNSLTEKGETHMAGANLDAVIGRAVRDAAFRKRLMADSESIGKEYNLSSEELATLQNFSQDSGDEFFGKIVGGRAVAYCTSKTCYENG